MWPKSMNVVAESLVLNRKYTSVTVGNSCTLNVCIVSDTKADIFNCQLF
jgi:hypothetical protein